MNYTLHQLRIFHKISENQSVTKTAEELHLTQPAVSIQLKNFQQQFPLDLTEVVGRQLYLTEFGKEIAEASARILGEVESIDHRIKSYGGQLAGRLKIAVVSTGKYVMPYFLSSFMEQHPGVDLEMDVTNKTRVVETLENNEVDFALVSVLPKHLPVNQVKLMNNVLYLVGKRDAVSPRFFYQKGALEKVSWLFREPGSATRAAMENYLKSREIRIQKKIELTSNEAVKQSVLAGLGFSVMPLIGLKNELNAEDLQVYPCKGLPVTTTWNLISLKNKSFSPVAEAFLKYVEEEKKDIIANYFSWYEEVS